MTLSEKKKIRPKEKKMLLDYSLHKQEARVPKTEVQRIKLGDFSENTHVNPNFKSRAVLSL